jgi:WD40 repeat protein
MVCQSLKSIIVAACHIVFIELAVPTHVQSQATSCSSQSFPYKFNSIGTLIKSPRRDLGPVSSLAISPDSRNLIIGTRADPNGNIGERLKQKQLIFMPVVGIDDKSLSAMEFSSMEYDVGSVSFHPSGRFFAAYILNGFIQLFDTSQPKKPFFDLLTQQQHVNKISFSYDGSYLLSLRAISNRNAEQKSSNLNAKNLVIYKVKNRKIELEPTFRRLTKSHSGSSTLQRVGQDCE